MPIDRAFESPSSQNHSSFILTIGRIVVSIIPIVGFTITRYLILMQEMNVVGMCLLLEVPSIRGLVRYFLAIHSLGDSLELRRVYIGSYEITAVNSVREEGVQSGTHQITAVNSVREEHNCSYKNCFDVVPYVNY